MSYPSSNKEIEFNNIALEKLDSMSTAELLALLENLNDTMTEDNFNDELVTACLDALDRKSPMPAFMTAEESWHSFENKVGLDDTGSITSASVNRTGRKVKRVFRTGLVAAIIVFCLFSCMIVAQAAGVDVFGAIARWTDDVFGFGSLNMEASDINTPSGAVEKVNQETICFIKTWLPALPDEYIANNSVIEFDTKSGAVAYSSSYSYDGNTIRFDAYGKLGNTPISIFEKDAEPVEQLSVRDCQIYVFGNLDNTVAAWFQNGIEFSLTSNLSAEKLVQLIHESF